METASYVLGKINPHHFFRESKDKSNIIPEVQNSAFGLMLSFLLLFFFPCYLSGLIYNLRIHDPLFAFEVEYLICSAISIIKQDLIDAI